MFRSIVQNSPLGVLVVDGLGEIVFCNFIASNTLAPNNENIIGKKVREILPGIIIEGNAAQSKSFNNVSGPLEIISVDGKKSDYEVKLSHSADTYGNVLHIITLIDVTHNVQALQAVEDQEQRWKLALQGSQIGVFESDLRTGAGLASQTWYDLLGIPSVKERDSDAEWHARVHPDDLAFVVSSDAQCIEGRLAKSEATFRMKVQDGTWRWMRSILRVTERDGMGKAVRLLGTMTDITEEKRVDELKNDFVATVSHELRTPLAAVYGALGLLVGSLGENASEKTQKLTGMAHRNTARLIQVVDELLDFQKLRTGHFSLEMTHIDVVDIVRQVAIDNEPFAEKFNVTFKIDVPDQAVFINADPLRLKQVLTNILSNAVKFSNPGEDVVIKLVCSKYECRVSVTDRGRGISPDFRKIIFQPFSQQADHLTRNKGGSGLGLAISKGLVERMSGEIGYESDPGVETTFWITFPVI